MKKYILIILLFPFISNAQWSIQNYQFNVTDSGSLGIGTITPTSRLHVFGNGTASGLLNITNDKDATKDSSVVIDAIGNVGIGKEIPTTKLYVQDTTSSFGGTAPVAYIRTAKPNKIALGAVSVSGGNEFHPDYNIGLYASSRGGTNNFAGYFNLGDVYINNNLGIGRLTPTYRLDIFGNGGTDNLLKVSNDINSTYDSTFVVDKVGKVGIGTTTPLYNLDIGDGGTSDVNPKVIRINSSNKGGSCPLLCFSKSDTIRGIIGIYPATISSNKNDFTIESDWQSNIVLTTSRSEKHLEIDQNGNLIAYKEIMWRDSLGDYQKGTTLSDNEAYSFPTNISWKGEIDVDSLGYTLFTAQIRCDANGTPYLEGVSWKRWSSKTYVEVGSTDGYLNITDGGSGMVITNTLGYTIKATLRFRTKQ